MRELSVIELELIIGGYDNGGSYGDSSYVVDTSGNYEGTLAAGDEQAVQAEFTAQGFDIPVEIKVGPVKISGSVPVSKKKKK